MTTDVEVCRCELCLALLNLAESAARNLRQRRAARKLTIVEDTRSRKGKVAA